MRYFVVLLLLVLICIPLAAQETPTPLPEELVEDAVRAAEDANRAVEQAFSLLGLFEAFGIVVTFIAGVAGFFGFARLGSARSELVAARERVENELEQLRKSFDAEIEQRRTEFDKLRQSLESSAAERQKTTERSLLAQAFIPLGERQYRAQDFTGALESYKRALELDPINPVIHYRLGYVYTHTGELEEAKKHYLEAIALAEEFAPALAGLGFVYRRTAEKMEEGIARDQMFNEAEKLLLQALELSPKLVDDDGESWWGILGGLYRRRGQVDQAIYAYRQATIVTPQSSYGFGNLAFLYMQKNNREEMLKTYAEVENLAAAEAQADVDNYWGHADLLVARYALGKAEEAAEVLERALQIAPPDSPYVLQSLIDTLEDLSGVLESEKIPALRQAIARINEYRSKPQRVTQDMPAATPKPSE